MPPRNASLTAFFYLWLTDRLGMRTQLLGTLVASILVAGCATSSPQPVVSTARWSDLAKDDNRCTDIISVGGGVIKFCQTESTVQVFESGVDLAAERRKLDVINDPKALLALQKTISARPDLQASRRLVAKACTVNGVTYLTLSLESLKKIVNAAGPNLVSSDPGNAGADAGRAEAPAQPRHAALHQIEVVKTVSVETVDAAP